MLTRVDINNVTRELPGLLSPRDELDGEECDANVQRGGGKVWRLVMTRLANPQAFTSPEVGTSWTVRVLQ